MGHTNLQKRLGGRGVPVRQARGRSGRIPPEERCPPRQTSRVPRLKAKGNLHHQEQRCFSCWSRGRVMRTCKRGWEEWGYLGAKLAVEAGDEMLEHLVEHLLWDKKLSTAQAWGPFENWEPRHNVYSTPTPTPTISYSTRPDQTRLRAMALKARHC